MKKKPMHKPGIEPGSIAWQATILPLDHLCEKKTNAQTGNRTRVNSMASYYSTTRPFVPSFILIIFFVLYINLYLFI